LRNVLSEQLHTEQASILMAEFYELSK